jgi:hypothetical protein
MTAIDEVLKLYPFKYKGLRSPKFKISPCKPLKLETHLRANHTESLEYQTQLLLQATLSHDLGEACTTFQTLNPEH